MSEHERLFELLCTVLWGSLCNHCGADKMSEQGAVLEIAADYLLKHGVRCMPFIAMIEQTTENGEFSKKKGEQKFNGRYCLVYEDKTKWGTPLIDICGTKQYNTEEAERALEEREKNE